MAYTTDQRDGQKVSNTAKAVQEANKKQETEKKYGKPEEYYTAQGYRSRTQDLSQDV